MKASKLNSSLLLRVLIFLVVTVFLPVLYYIVVSAKSVTTSVTVGNSAPAFTAGPAEQTASSNTSPTNSGGTVTFQATAVDPNGENYYLAICKTNSITPVNGGAPTCGGGNYCITTSTSSGTQVTCPYVTSESDPQVNNWYAFVCDGNASAATCSASSQGTGNSGSPFEVNHRPVFTSVTDNGGTGTDSGADPGGTMTFTSVASDSDTSPTADTMKLLICTTNQLSGTNCAGTQICVSNYASSNPSCTYTIPSVKTDETIDYFAFVFDSHDYGATANPRSGSYVVNNVSPTVSSVTLNSGSNITPNVGSTVAVPITATITDNNSCTDLTTVETSLYRSGIGFASCDADAEDNNNYCYAQVTCTVVGGTCAGNTDASANYTCSVSVQFHADATTANSKFPSENWLSTVKAIDNNSATGTSQVAAGVEMNETTGVGTDADASINVTSSINYGNLTVGQKNDPLDKIVTVTSIGNIGVDVDLSGTNLTGGGSTIPVGSQKYAFAASTAYASGTSVTTSPVNIAAFNLKKTTVTASPETKNIWYGIEIPTNILPGAYSGTNQVAGVRESNTANW